MVLYRSILCLVAAQMFIGCAVNDSGLRPFTTDGCSAFPDGPLGDEARWRDPCVVHDLAYWQGGTSAQRLAADQALRKAVAEGGDPIVAAMMYLGVRLGGSPWWQPCPN